LADSGVPLDGRVVNTGYVAKVPDHVRNSDGSPVTYSFGLGHGQVYWHVDGQEALIPLAYVQPSPLELAAARNNGLNYSRMATDELSDLFLFSQEARDELSERAQAMQGHATMSDAMRDMTRIAGIGAAPPLLIYGGAALMEGAQAYGASAAKFGADAWHMGLGAAALENSPFVLNTALWANEAGYLLGGMPSPTGGEFAAARGAAERLGDLSTVQATARATIDPRQIVSQLGNDSRATSVASGGADVALSSPVATSVRYPRLLEVADGDSVGGQAPTSALKGASDKKGAGEIGSLPANLSVNNIAGLRAIGLSDSEISELINTTGGDLWVFRGTRAGATIAGGESSQMVGFTPVTIDPLRATIFALGRQSTDGVPGVVLFGSSSNLGVNLGVGNTVFGQATTSLIQLEREMGAEVAPSVFAQRASHSISAQSSLRILNSMGFDIQPIVKRSISEVLENYPAMTPQQTQQYIQRAVQFSGAISGG
jgi:hypothetical protein